MPDDKEPPSTEAVQVAPYDGPDLIYGLWRDEAFVVVGKEWARAAAKEIEAIYRARTWGEAVAASLAAVNIWGPLDEEYLKDYAPDEAFNVAEIPAYGDGDWPEMVCSYTGQFMPDDWPIGEVYSTVLSGDGIVIDRGDEARLVEIARAAGAPLNRDDSAIAGLDPDWADPDTPD